MMAIDLLLGTAGVAALIAPGWIMARAWRVPVPSLGGFLAGGAMLVTLVLVFGAIGVPLRTATLLPAWATIVAAALWGARRIRKTDSATATPASPGNGRQHWPLWLPLIPAVAVVSWRATTQPLFGVDTIFRWNYLAEQMLARQTLAFYPPVTAGDFAIYDFPDGIAPAVSSLYFWLYALGGGARPELTAPLVILQFVLVFLVARALARRLCSERAAAFAGALVAVFPLVLWATAMGQETGLTALSFAALLLYLPAGRADENIGAWIFAGLAAGLGALAREYGLVLPLLGLALGLARGLSRRGLLLFASVTVLAAAPWYLRNWLRTGNPLYDLSVAGMFPVNPVHAWLNESFRAELSWAHLPPEAPRLMLTYLSLGLVATLAGGWIFFRKARAFLLTIGVVAALWIASVSLTAAGFVYALRVLNPALILAAVLGGAALARWIPERRWLGAATVALSLLALDASLRALTLPANVYRVPPADWLTVGGGIHEFHQHPRYREFATLAGHERMIVLGPNALLTRQGAQTVPLWSPEVRFLFDSTLPPAEIARRLRARGIGYALLSTGAVNERFLAHSAFFRDPAGALQPLWSDPGLVLLRVAPEKK